MAAANEERVCAGNAKSNKQACSETYAGVINNFGYFQV